MTPGFATGPDPGNQRFQATRPCSHPGFSKSGIVATYRVAIIPNPDPQIRDFKYGNRPRCRILKQPGHLGYALQTPTILELL